VARLDGAHGAELIVSLPFSASLPPAGRLPFQRWLHVVVLYAFT
jgi:hypothetical protein